MNLYGLATSMAPKRLFFFTVWTHPWPHPKAYKFIVFGNIHGPTGYKFIRLGDIHGTKAYKFLRFGDIRGSKTYNLFRAW